MTPTKRLKILTETITSSFQEFFQKSFAAGITILVCSAIAMIWANSGWHESYEGLRHMKVAMTFGSLNLQFSFEQFVNDALMVLFFLVVGLEIKREVLVGELSSRKKAMLPMVAALSGMLFPGLIYAAFNLGTPQIRGWGVPVATDIAFALGILALLGPRVPLGLKVFLAALAIVDDLLSVLVIAIFYTSTLNVGMLLWAVIVTAALYLLNRLGVQKVWIYAILGVVLWLCVLFSGVHATIAGVVLALTIPGESKIDGISFFRKSRDLVDRIAKKVENDEEEGLQLDAVHTLENLCENVQSPLHRIEHGMQTVVTFIILPLFALINAGVAIDTTIAASLASPVSLGIMFGLFVGKQIGVTLAAVLSVRFGIADLPANVDFKQVYGVSILCGIGFTMALFVGHLAFQDAVSLDIAKLSILIGSAISAIVGSLVLRSALPRTT